MSVSVRHLLTHLCSLFRRFLYRGETYSFLIKIWLFFLAQYWQYRLYNSVLVIAFSLQAVITKANDSIVLSFLRHDPYLNSSNTLFKYVTRFILTWLIYDMSCPNKTCNHAYTNFEWLARFHNIFGRELHWSTLLNGLEGWVVVTSLLRGPLWANSFSVYS